MICSEHNNPEINFKFQFTKKKKYILKLNKEINFSFQFTKKKYFKTQQRNQF